MMKDAALLYIPLIFSVTTHMFIVRFNTFQSLSIPFNQRAFGKNKTYRGLITVTLLTAVAYPIMSNGLNHNLSPLNYAIGALLGLTYILFELPNSYLKRKLNIPPGQSAPNYAFWFKLLDKLDSVIGICLVYVLIYQLSFTDYLTLVLFALIINYSLSSLLVLLKVKESL